MDFNYFDPTNPAHMELVNMMMQMENVPEFSEMTPASVLDFSGGSGTPPPYYGPNSSTSPTLTSQFGGSHQIAQPQYSSDELVDPSVGPDKRASMAAMREMIFRIAAMQPVNIDPEAVKPPKRRNVKISKDPQSVAARHRRERISERIRILQRLVPGGTKMDTASMLDEAIHYVKFLKSQVQSLERVAANRNSRVAVMGSTAGSSFSGNFPYFNSDMYYD